MVGQSEQTMYSNKGKNFIIFNDKSGSMSGTPFDTLKFACLGIKDALFSEGNKFEDVTVVYYDHAVYP
jgi:uncharacterized protein with von Willebrand factor type A (vWA) domain